MRLLLFVFMTMKKLFYTSILLMQIVGSSTYAANLDSTSESFLGSYMNLSYRSAILANQEGFKDFTTFNHGGTVGIYCPVQGGTEVGLELDVIRPTGLFLDKDGTEADMLASSIMYSGLFKLQKQLTISDDIGITAGVGVGPTYLTFDTFTGTDKGAPYEDRKVDSKLQVTAVGDLSFSFPLTGSLSGRLGYSFQYTPLGDLTMRESDSEQAIKGGSIVSHAVKVGISAPLEALFS
ncbi:hypothetical protein [Neorickettsia helminthoeca]|nr:hypothetical protein [Neorickettsia helminthoeca]